MIVAPHIRLFVVQPTPFCNIDCDYCYLPNRGDTGRLTADRFRRALERINEARLLGPELSIVWHAGEPLALPVGYYESLFAALRESPVSPARIRHSIQTNGTLLSEEWCDFIQQEGIHIGLSIDGPAFVHDRHRKDRRGKGTHARAMEGAALLRRRGIDFHVIAVVTADSLDYADEIFSFFLDEGIQRVGFNIEELEGVNRNTSIHPGESEQRLRGFWRRLYDRQRESGGAVQIREFGRAYQAITQTHADASAEEFLAGNDQAAPFGIVSMDWQGNLSSFSPELLGIKSLDYGDFNFGNVETQELRAWLEQPKFVQIAGSIAKGVALCKERCEYFCVCGGGAPANKYFENGTFASTETTYCRATIQMPTEIVLAEVERSLAVAAK